MSCGNDISWSQSVSQFSRSVVSDSLRPHESQHTRPPCPSPTPRVHSNSCASSQWCHPTISSTVIPFSCPQSFSASESFPMSHLSLASSGQSIGVSVLPMNVQGWFSLGLTGLISLLSKGLLVVQGIYILQGNLVGILDIILCNNNLTAKLKKNPHGGHEITLSYPCAKCSWCS